jgi:DNA-binding winged helix-turn-helix (wHTH) protein
MDRNSEEAALLVAQAGPLNGQRFPMRSNLLIGRDDSCDVVIPDRQVSRHHPRLTSSTNGVTLEDLGSKNGTHYNGQPLIKSVYLQDGDIIQIALAQRFMFLSSDATVPLESDEFEFAPIPSTHSQPLVGQLRLEKRSRRVWIGDKEVLPPLSVSQFRLLELLYEHQGRVVPRQELIADVWGEIQAVEVSEQALDALVRRLRDRLASVDSVHAYIVTIRGHGLRLDNPPENE